MPKLKNCHCIEVSTAIDGNKVYKFIHPECSQKVNNA